MLSDSGKNVSIWMATTPTLSTSPLAQDATADVCVVGAGIAGLTAAYGLAREGRSVIVLDDGAIGGGETSRTTAHLATGLDDRYHRLEKLHGKDGARLAAESHGAAIRFIEETARGEGIDCDFRRVDGYLFVPPGESTSRLEHELEAAHRAGLTGAELGRIPYDGYDFGTALRFPDQAQFHPMKYLRGLADAVQRLGGTIHTGTHVEDIDNGTPVQVKVQGGLTVRCADVVVATNSPVNDRVAVHTKQAAYRTYVIALQIPRGAVPELLLWDTPDPYHYLRVCSASAGWPEALADHDLLLVGGEDHKTGQAEDFETPYRKLEDWARERFRPAHGVALRWSGQVLEPVDSLAFLGRNPLNRDHVFIVTGDSGNGLTHGTIGGMLITDLIVGRANPWERLYQPSRKSLRTAGTFARENLNVAGKYAELATPGEVESAAEIAAGTGAIVRHGLKKIAAYRDDDGTLHQRSAFCTHLGCVVAWNASEQTWDCPCHGSRFDKLDGHPLNGPAVSALHEVDDGETPAPPPGDRDRPVARE